MLAVWLFLKDWVGADGRPILFFFSGIFALFGTVFISRGIRLLEEILHHEQPFWIRDFAWDPAGRDDTTAGILLDALSTISILLILLVPLHWVFIREFEGAALVVLIIVLGPFDLIILAILVHMMRRVLRCWWFGAVRLEFTQFPYRPGREVVFLLRMPVGLQGISIVRGHLLCLVELTQSEGDVEVTHHEALWEAKG
jgi:hypothetical protein